MTLIILKYLVSAATLAITLAGAWLFEFTTLNKDTGKKSLTKWGKLALVPMLALLLASAAFTILGDVNSTRKREEAEAERKIEAEHRLKLEVQLGEWRSDNKQLLELISKFQLDKNEQQDLAKTVKGLKSIGEIKRDYPALYAQILDARTLGDFSKPILSAIRRKIAERYSTQGDCPRFKLAGLYSDTGLVLFESDPVVSFVVREDGIQLGFTLWDDPHQDFEGYVNLKFSGGTQSKLDCLESAPSSSCHLFTGSDPRFQSIFIELQNKQIATIETSRNTYKLSESDGMHLKQIFACLIP
jgi:hypothetical protein